MRVLNPRVRLGPLTPDLYPAVYAWSVDPRVGWRWKYRGTTPSFEAFVQHLWDGVLVQHAVHDGETGAFVGIIYAYNYNGRGQYAYIGALTDPDLIGQGLLAEAGVELVEHLFDKFEMRRIHFEAFEFNAQQFGGFTRFLEEEARFKEREFSDGKWWDFVIYTLSRASFEAMRASVLWTEYQQTKPDQGAAEP